MPITENRTMTVPEGAPRARRGMRQSLFLASISLGAIATSLLILKVAPAPFFWVFLTLAAALFIAMFGVFGAWPRAILFNLGIVAILLAAAEGYLITHEYTPLIAPPGFWARDDILGWAPTKGRAFHVSKPNPTGLFHGPEGLLFDATYTIDPNGLRVAPPWRKDDLAGTVLFFGCSFAFGEGLQDNETLPYQVGVQSGGRYRTYNFAFEAYNPAQMLEAIEHGMVTRVVETTPKYAFYVALPTHVWRVAGRVGWGNHAPRYVLGPNGSVHQAGNFEGRPPLALRLGLGRRIAGQLDKSAIWRAISTRDSPITDDDIRLYFAVVRRSEMLLKAQYPGIQFRVLLWPPSIPAERGAYQKLQEGFRQMGIPLDLVENALPDYKTDELKYLLSSMDRHPNALANRLLATYLLSIIGR